nr:MAG TPA: hypothetical protein [Caudoviricetes sp.]
MLHHAGIDLNTAEQMPMHYALAFLSEKAGLLQAAKPKLERERHQNTRAAPPQSTSSKSYVSTERKCSKPKTGVSQ